MKYVSTTAVLLVALCGASAQVASHAPAKASAMAPAMEQRNPSPVLDVTGKTVARVNGTSLTDQDLLREMFTIFPYARQHNGFPKLQEAAIRKGALEMIVFEELVYQEAGRRNMTVPPAKLDRAVAAFHAGFRSQEEYKQFLQVEYKGSRQVLRQGVRRSLLIEALLKTEVENRSAISPAAVRANYDKNPKSFVSPESFEIQTISLIPPKDANAEQLKALSKRAEDALRKAKATKSFEQFGLLAEKLSEDDYRVNMGARKPASRDQLPAPVVKVLGSMKPGQVSELIQLDKAYTIVRLDVHDVAGKKKFAEVKDALAKSMQKLKSNQLRSDFDKRLRKNAKVELL